MGNLMSVAPDLTPTKNASLSRAAEALEGAIGLASTRQEQLIVRIEAARTTLQVVQAEIAKGPPTEAKDLPQAFGQASGALKAACELIDSAWIEGKVGNPTDEWKECRATIDRCDKLIVDLRKTGVGFVVAVVGAAAYIFNESQRFGGKSSVLCMLVLLIVILYFVDLAHQSWLDTAVKRAIELEGDLHFKLTSRIGERFSASEAQFLGFALYTLLLVATCGVFWFSIPLSVEPVITGHRGTIYGAFVIGLSSIGIAFVAADKDQKTVVQPFRGIIFFLAGAGIVATILAGLLFR
jgi:hypothetical protein